jgi:hypothetical protein
MTCRALLAIGWLVASTTLPCGAQERLVERRHFSDGQGKLMAFYSAALTFTPVNAPRQRTRGTLEAGLELAYVPRLTAEQRRVGDKPEATNLAPVFPRPRLTYSLTDRLAIEGSWLPPVEVFDVKANVVSLALSWTSPLRGSLRVAPRLAGTIGSVEGAITCFEELGTRSPDLALYYGTVCYGRESRDDLQPRHALAEVMVGWEREQARVAPYAGLGARGDWTRFDIGVIRGDGSIETDHPILELRTVRPYGVLGATLRAATRARATAELLYAPGSIVTIRLQGTIDAIRR